jgi:acetyltransferase EpsM
VKVLIVCAGAHGTDVAAWSDRPILGFLDDEKSGPNIFGPTTLLNLIDADWVAGHNSGTVRQLYAKVANRKATKLLSSHATIDSSVVAKDGVVVGPNSTVGPLTVLGSHTHINANVFVTRASLGDFCTVSPGATICGDVMIGDHVSIGAGATISNLVLIQSNVTVGAGCVIPPGQTLPAHSTWVGVPGRRIK